MYKLFVLNCFFRREIIVAMVMCGGKNSPVVYGASKEQ